MDLMDGARIESEMRHLILIDQHQQGGSVMFWARIIGDELVGPW